MGIPGFFFWVAKKYRKVLNPMSRWKGCDNLYLDMNGIIHPCCHPEGKRQPSTEEEMIQNVFGIPLLQILEYIDHVVKIAKPRKLMYFAIDGVAPRAKMNQQRSRRYRSALERAVREETKDEPNPSQKKVEWDSNVITPGTTFMDNLSEALKWYIQNRISNNPLWQNLSVVFSDSNVPGEGEHKIMKFVRGMRTTQFYDPNTVHMLHGLDADLFMLALATHEAHFYLLRENVRQIFAEKREKTRLQTMKGNMKADLKLEEMALKKFPEFEFANITRLREYLRYELRPNHQLKFDIELAYDDFIFLCFFVGNDFLPHLPSFAIHNGAIDYLILLYKTLLLTLPGHLSRGHGQLNWNNVRVFISELGLFSLIWLGKFEDQRYAGKKEVSTKAEKKAKYYRDKVGVMNPDSPLLKQMAVSYIEGLCWVFGYYYKGCRAWDWYYPFHYAPYDALDLLISVDEYLKIEQKFEEPTIPFKPYDQLMSVLPPVSGKLTLPKAYYSLMADPLSPITDFYPTAFKFDFFETEKAWKAVALLPFLDEKRLLRAIATVSHNLTPEQKKKNSLGKPIVFLNKLYYSKIAAKIFPLYTSCQEGENSFESSSVGDKRKKSAESFRLNQLNAVDHDFFGWISKVQLELNQYSEAGKSPITFCGSVYAFKDSYTKFQLSDVQKDLDEKNQLSRSTTFQLLIDFPSGQVHDSVLLQSARPDDQFLNSYEVSLMYTTCIRNFSKFTSLAGSCSFSFNAADHGWETTSNGRNRNGGSQYGQEKGSLGLPVPVNNQPIRQPESRYGKRDGVVGRYQEAVPDAGRFHPKQPVPPLTPITKGHWTQWWDPVSSRFYYANHINRETTWHKPPGWDFLQNGHVLYSL